MSIDINQLDWDKCQGLIPAIVQDAASGQVLMLGYMNAAALQQSMATKKVTFYSRSKQRLWVKGESSGNYLHLVNVSLDCDQDALLFQVNPQGPTCHLGNRSCFNQAELNDWQLLSHLEAVIAARSHTEETESYTASLLKQGLKKVSQKVGEEGVETVIAALVEDDERLCNETADLIYHLLVLLHLRELSFHDIVLLLKNRLQTAYSS